MEQGSPRLLTCDIQLQGVCQQVADKVDAIRGPNAAGPPKKVDYGNMSLQQIEAQNDAYFGLDDTELEDIRPPPRAAYAAPLAAPARTPAPTRAPAPTPTPVPVPAPAPKAEGKKDRDGRAISSLSRVQVFTPPSSASHCPPCLLAGCCQVLQKPICPSFQRLDFASSYS